MQTKEEIRVRINNLEVEKIKLMGRLELMEEMESQSEDKAEEK